MAVGVLVLATLVAIVLLAGGNGGDDDRRLVLVADQATNIFTGVPVRAAGQKVGEIAEAAPLNDGRARLVLRIDDERVWPVPRDSRFQMRFGGSISANNRYVEMLPGRSSDGLPDGATVDRANVVVPLEIDELAGTLDAASRRDLKALLNRLSMTAGNARGDLRRSLDRAPDALREAHTLVEDLGADERALDTLVRSADSVVAAVDSATPGLGDLIGDASQTFDAVAAEAAALRRTLAETPSTLREARSTLSRADGTLLAATALTDRLAPGVRELRRTTAPLTRVLETVGEIGPDARRTLSNLRRATPDLNPLLSRTRKLSPTITSVGREASRQLACLRPYAPEVAGFAATWASWLSQGDGTDKFARVNLQTYPFPTNFPLSSKEFSPVLPAVFESYAFPRPPGTNAGKPWLIPECGVGPDALDPKQDPEARPFDPLSKSLVTTDDDAEHRPPTGGRR